MRSRVVLALTGSIALASSAARADDCPAGSWFCTPPPPAAAAPSGSKLEQLPAPAAGTTTVTTTTTTTTTQTPAPAPAPVPRAVPTEREPQLIPLPPVQPPAPTVIIRDHAPTPLPRAKTGEWGINLHAGGLILGSRSNRDAGMGMLGGGLRLRPNPYFAVEADVDLAGGRDFEGRSRSEAALSFNGLVFLNPKSRVQVYLLGGFGWSAASVNGDSNITASSFYSQKRDFTYFGVQGGAGLEWRVSRYFALNSDIRGIVRGRTDDERNANPEFTDAQGRSTNTSGAGLVQLGMTVYF